MILDEILDHKRREVAERMACEPLLRVVERAEAAPPARDFHGALRGPGISIIAEVKRHSPARGALRLDMDAATQAATYADGGASCVSVLTDARYFHGSDADLVAVRERVGVPVLRKDFVVDPYQVYEARAIGADCVLLIVRALERDELASLARLAASLGMAALVEVHADDELRVALEVGATLVGINNRDLTRMVVDLETTARLRPLVPDGVTLVSESGIRTPDDIGRLREIRVDAALIGESLVVADDPKALLRAMIAAGRRPGADTTVTRVKICGIRSVEHGRAALAAGADFLGFVFYRPSHRYVEPAAAREIVAACRAELGRPERWRAVGVFVDEPVDAVRAIADEAGLDLIQLCGSEDADYARCLDRPVLRVVHVDGEGRLSASPDPGAHGAERILLDTQATGHFGGTGQTYPWAAVRAHAGAAILAGGLAPSNVADAIAAASPWGVDVSSGVERDRVKDPDLIRAFISEVRRADR